jgi:hypothetical protein
MRVAASSGPLTAKPGTPGRSRCPALSTKSGIGALLQGTRGGCDRPRGRALNRPGRGLLGSIKIP